MKKKLILMILTGLSSSAFAQSATPQSNSNLEVKAVVDAGCFLTADNINFGILMMPLTNQVATSNIQVKCSKGVNLKFNMQYGANDSGSGGYSVVRQEGNSSSTVETARLYKDGVGFSNNSIDIQCRGDKKGYVYLYHSVAMTSLFGTNGSVIDKWNLCVTNGVRVNRTTIANMGSTGYGILSGLSSGESIKYFMETPTSSSTVWNLSNSYQILSTGEYQTIQMKANIKSENNVTHRMTPDTYQSSLIVVLTY